MNVPSRSIQFLLYEYSTTAHVFTGHRRLHATVQTSVGTRRLHPPATPQVTGELNPSDRNERQLTI